MSQTILIEPNDDLRKIYSINLTSFIGTDVIIRKSAEEALALLKILPEINLIITKSQIGKEPTAKLISNYLKNESLDTELIVIGSVQELPESLCLEEPVSWEVLIKHASNLLGVSLEDYANKTKPEYIPVGLFYFYEIQNTPCDVFIKIKKARNEYQYVKRIHSKDSFDKETIQKYEAQGLKEFYIPKDYIQFFSTFVTNAIVLKLETDHVSLEDQILTTANAHEVVRDAILIMGLEQPIVELSESAINSMVKSIKKTADISYLLKLLFTNKVSYAYQHSHLLALLGHQILSRQSWYKEEHLYIITFVSFFSDITLKSHQQMKINSMKDLAQARLLDIEKEEVINHASDAAKILEDHPEASDYIKTVLLQSHGRPDGIGIEENPGEEIHPLSKVFIVADAFVKTLLNPALPSKKQDILPLLYSRFTNPSYQKIIKTLEYKFE